MNPMGKNITKRSTTSENITYLVDNKTFMCQHETFHPLTARRGEWVSETMDRDIEKSFNKTYINTSLQCEEMVYQLRN